MEKLYNIYKELFDMENEKPLKTQLTDNEWTVLEEGDYEKIKDELEKIIKENNLNRHETETEIDGRKYIVESWLTDKGEMVIQRMYEPDSKKPLTKEELQSKLNQALMEENYEEAAKLQAELKKFE